MAETTFLDLKKSGCYTPDQALVHIGRQFPKQKSSGLSFKDVQD
jgi:hypothetical protein